MKCIQLSIEMEQGPIMVVKYQCSYIGGIIALPVYNNSMYPQKSETTQSPNVLQPIFENLLYMDEARSTHQYFSART